jgi:superfamily I DNA and/or RNA helicase
VLRNTFPAYVLDVSGGVATLETRYANLFESGDIIGLVFSSERIEKLGTVIDSSHDILTAFTSLHLKEGWDLRIANYEPLIAFDLQIGLIDRIENDELKEFEKKAVNLFFEKIRIGELGRIELENKYNAKGKYMLDESQIDAIEASLALKDGEFLLIRGPPGTGKTVVIAKIAHELAKKEKVLIASHTNRAVDNAIEELSAEEALRIGRPEKVLPSIRKYLLGYKARQDLGDVLEEIEKEIKKNLDLLVKVEEDARKASGFERSKLNEVRRKYKEYIRHLYTKRNEMLRKASEELVEEMPIIGSTLVKSQLYPLAKISFDTVIIDECSQASLTLALLGMVKGRKWILVGDDRQLLPIFRTLKNSKELSAFFSLLSKYRHRMKMLRIHRRSHPEIINFSAKHIYEGKIKPARECWSHKLKAKASNPVLDPDKPVVFVHVEGEEGREGGSKFNSKEIDVCIEITRDLKRYLNPKEIGIISPYVAQRKKIAEKVKVEVDTVDAFQGREKDVVIFSITSTGEMRFVSNPNRLNVAFTRARRKLIVVGNGKAIYRSKDCLLYKFLEYAYELGRIYDWEKKSWC